MAAVETSSLQELVGLPVAQAAYGAALAVLRATEGRQQSLLLAAAARGAAQGAVLPAPDLAARLDAVGEELKARMAIGRLVGEEAAPEQPQQARAALAKLAKECTSTVEKRNLAVHRLGTKKTDLSDTTVQNLPCFQADKNAATVDADKP